MKKKLITLFLIAFIFRFFLIFTAYHGDLNNNISWGNALLKYGFNGYYEQKIWEFSVPNQPPVYIFLFGLTSFIYKNTTQFVWFLNNNLGIFPSGFIWFWETWGMKILVKIPSILADLGIAFLIYKFFEKNRSLGMKLSALWLFNPIIWYNSGIWGQTDSIVNFLGLVSIFYLTKKKIVKSLLFLVFSFLFKGSLLIFLPIWFFFGLWQKYPLRNWLKALFFSGILVFLITVWFHPAFDLPFWLFNLYNKQILPGEIGYLTANAFNFWWLINPGKVLDSSMFFGLSARFWGYLVFIFGLFLTLIGLRKKITLKNLFISLSLVSLISFLFLTRIHERYLYPFFPIATILIGLESAFIFPYIALSFIFLLNMYHLFWAPSIPFLENIFQTSQLPVIASIFNLAIFFIFIHLSVKKFDK